MPEGTKYDTTDKGTLRPNTKPLEKHGEQYSPMNLPDYPPEIRLPEHASPEDPISIFSLYYTPEIIDWIVQETNNYSRPLKEDGSEFKAVENWYSTTSDEIYLYLAIRIYMTYNVQNEIADYWKTKSFIASHDISQYMARDRFQELHIRVRYAGRSAQGPYEKVGRVSNHIQAVNLQIFIPGRDVAVDEVMVRYEGRAKETTTIPNKPIPTGFKVWAIACQGFLLCWNWHIPGNKKGPVDTPTPRALGGTIRHGNGGNKTQAVVIKLLQRLPEPLTGYGYHCYLDNLFVSTKLVSYARQLGFGITGTCRPNSGIIKELVDLKKSDKNDNIHWGTLYSYPTVDGRIIQIGWKDQAFVLFMSSVLSPDNMITRFRKRPKETSSKAKTSRIPFGKQATKELEIPVIADGYNHGMGAVDEFDHLTSSNSGLRHIRRGGHQALDHWLLLGVLVNSFLLAERSEVDKPRQICFRNQVEFRQQIVEGLIAKAHYRSPKKRVAIIDPQGELSDPHLHRQVHMKKRGRCVACKGGRYNDRPQKRIALSDIAANQGRPSSIHYSSFGCEQCDIYLCNNNRCFEEFHSK